MLLGVRNDELTKFNARCLGFVSMPHPAHALIWFPQTGQLSRFMQQWKGRSSSRIKEFLFQSLPEYGAKFSVKDPIWQVTRVPVWATRSRWANGQRAPDVSPSCASDALSDDRLKWLNSAIEGGDFPSHSPRTADSRPALAAEISGGVAPTWL